MILFLEIYRYFAKRSKKIDSNDRYLKIRKVIKIMLFNIKYSIEY